VTADEATAASVVRRLGTVGADVCRPVGDNSGTVRTDGVTILVPMGQSQGEIPSKARTQRTIGWLSIALLGFLFGGNVLNSYLNVRNVITLERASWTTAALVVAWLLVSFRLALTSFPWIVHGQRIWISRLGVHFTAFLCGLVFLLWAPVLVGLVWPPVRQSLTDEERDRLPAILKATAEPRDRVWIGCPPASEGDACLLAGDLLRAFRRAGWAVENNRVDRVPYAEPLTGIVLTGPARAPDGPGQLLQPDQVPDELRGDAPKDHAEAQAGDSFAWAPMTPSLIALEQALKAVDLQFRSRADATGKIPPRAIEVYVGPRPFEPRSSP